MDVELWDCAAGGGRGARTGTAAVALDLAEFEPFAARPATVALSGADGQVSKRPKRALCFNPRTGTLFTSARLLSMPSRPCASLAQLHYRFDTVLS